MRDKSNRSVGVGLIRALPARVISLLADIRAQGTVEYMLIVVILVAPMAAALAVLFDAFDVLYAKLGYLIGRPYP